MQKSKALHAIIIVAITVIALIISLPYSYTSGPIWPDGQRYTFNGILVHDMVRDRACLTPVQYATQFYSKYPATNLPYGPPFLAVVFALAFGLFNISFFIARCVIAFHLVLAALAFFYLIIYFTKSYRCAALSVLAFL